MIWIPFIIFFIVMSGFYSGVETGSYSLNRMRLRHRMEQGSSRAELLHGLLKDPHSFVCLTLAGTNLAVYIATAICTHIFESRDIKFLGISDPELISTLILSPILLIFAEVTPKNVFRRRADTLMYYVVPALLVSSFIFKPLTIILRVVGRAWQKLVSTEAQTGSILNRRRLEFLLMEGAADGVLSLYQDTMARNVMKLGDTPVKQAMIPMGSVTMVEEGASLDEIRRMARRNIHSRLPVYKGSVDTVVGMVKVIDVLCEPERGSAPRDYMRTIVTVLADQPIDDVLYDLQRQNQLIAAVVDSAGRAIGIVTVKDLVEEIVGELPE